MTVLIDECLPRAMKFLLAGHDCKTVREMGWSGQSNGALLSLAEPDFDVLLTIDQGMQYQQNVTGRELALVVLVASSNRIEDLKPILPSIFSALQRLKAGEIVRVGP
jgi:hypothetical protein